MYKKRTATLKAKMLAAVALAVTAGFFVCIASISIRVGASQKDAAVRYAQELARTSAVQVAGELDVPLDIAANLADSLVAMRTRGVADRRVADDMLRAALESHKSFLGIATIWEPNAFDGRDQIYISTPGTDATGRYLPYWNRAGGSISVEASTNYDSQNQDGEYYQIPKKTGRPLVTEPYTGQAGGKQVMMTTLSVPIFLNGAFAGISEVDLALAGLQKAIGDIHPYGTGFASLVSEKGKLVAGGIEGEPNAMGTIAPEVGELIQGARAAGRNASGEYRDKEHGEMLGIVVPVPIIKTGQTWFLVITVPLSSVYAEVRRTQLVATLIGVVSVLAVSAILVFALSRLVLTPLGGEPLAAASLANRVAQGDLVSTSSAPRAPDASLMGALQNMQGSLRLLASDVRHNADGVAIASTEIAQGSIELSARTEQQAAALQETSATMEELATTVKLNAENAQEASNLASNATHTARTSRALMENVVSTMEEIAAGSKKVADIIAVIEGIAFQTNILALNAAVEAARAGEQGRGFAVVAGEVRNLAQRAANAAKDVNDLVTVSVGATGRGHELVSKAGETVLTAVTEIERVSAIMQEISIASREQGQGVQQISVAISEMDDATQRNAALVEQTAAAAEALKGQARTLSSAVGLFRTE